MIAGMCSYRQDTSYIMLPYVLMSFKEICRGDVEVDRSPVVQRTSDLGAFSVSRVFHTILHCLLNALAATTSVFMQRGDIRNSISFANARQVDAILAFDPRPPALLTRRCAATTRRLHETAAERVFANRSIPRVIVCGHESGE
jgi:hypothetical protein